MKMSENSINNKLLPQITFAFLLLATIISKHLNCEALALKQNNKVNSLSNRVSYQKGNANEAVPRMGPKVAAPSILSDYYNSILSNSQNNFVRMPAPNWPQTESFVPFSNVVDNNEYETGDEYYNDDNSDALKAAVSDLYYGNDVYQPEGWFNGPVILDTPENNVQTDEANDAQLNTLMMAYLLDQFDKLNKIKEESEKRGFQLNSDKQEEEFSSGSTQSPVVTTPTNIMKVTTHAIPKKLTAQQFSLFRRGQKEFPLLRPAADNEEKLSDNSNTNNWPQELEEKNLSQEDSLMNLKQQKGQLRTVRDVLTAQLDDLKKEGPKMH